MGVIDRFLGAGAAVTAVSNAASGVAEVFTQNATRRMELDEAAYGRAIDQLGAEFAAAHTCGWFDSLVNGLNRLPRPMLTIGTLALFVYAMAEPVGFGLRMQNLDLIPEPLWWLLGAIISFYFGAREAHYFRHRSPRMTRPPTVEPLPEPVISGYVANRQDAFSDNAALRDWAASRG